MKERHYFSHDYGARTDPKLQKVLMKLGHEGKSVYWDLIEMLYENEGYLSCKEVESYAFALRTTADLIEKLISSEFELFRIKGDLFYSSSVLARLEIREEKAQKSRAAANKRWGNKSDSNAHDMQTHKKKDADVMQAQCKSNADAMQDECNSNALKESKEKKSKVKKIKEKESKDTPAPEKPGAGYFTLLRNTFMQEYQEQKQTPYYFSGKDAGALKELEKKMLHTFKSFNEPPTPEKMVKYMRLLVSQKQNEFVADNLTLSIINMKYNEIIAGIKKQSTSSTDALKAEVLSRIQSQI